MLKNHLNESSVRRLNHHSLQYVLCGYQICKDETTQLMTALNPTKCIAHPPHYQNFAKYVYSASPHILQAQDIM